MHNNNHDSIVISRSSIMFYFVVLVSHVLCTCLGVLIAVNPEFFPEFPTTYSVICGVIISVLNLIAVKFLLSDVLHE